MKKSIYIFGIASANLMMLGCLFKIQHWPGASVLLVLATFLFCFFFLPAALMSSYQESKKYKWLHVVTMIVFFIGMMGTLFKVQHWPGAGFFLLIGIPLPFVLFLPVYLYQTRKEEKEGNANFLGIMFGLIFLAVFSVLLSLNVSREILNSFATSIDINDHVAFFSQSATKNFNGENSIKRQSDELYAYIDELKCELLTASGNNVCENNRLKSGYDPLQMMNKDNTDIPMQVLYGKGQEDKINALKTKITAYRELLLVSEKMNPALTELVNALFDLDTKETNWEQQEFASYQLIIVLDALSQIQSNVRLVESEWLAMK